MEQFNCIFCAQNVTCVKKLYSAAGATGDNIVVATLVLTEPCIDRQ